MTSQLAGQHEGLSQNGNLRVLEIYMKFYQDDQGSPKDDEGLEQGFVLRARVVRVSYG